ncbi:hypothetical protein HYALB_00005343 [Hymenoscyphus albidus]|uniref:Uncharacterized protein n=1 Tax=Hymenoscyphus albidus TaxID=595503 RepID=A0A9N9M3G6_9HELO|nr:hypothetical protein HYALB_00005343 [Hymenoscyphus albidus]
MDIGIGRGIVWLTWSGLDGLLMALTLPSHSIEGMRAYASDASPGAPGRYRGTEIPLDDRSVMRISAARVRPQYIGSALSPTSTNEGAPRPMAGGRKHRIGVRSRYRRRTTPSRFTQTKERNVETGQIRRRTRHRTASQEAEEDGEPVSAENHHAAIHNHLPLTSVEKKV